MFDNDSLKAGATVDGRFRLVRVLGQGGMGTVWLAHDRLQSDALIALKVLHPRFAHNAGAITRMTREAEVLERLDHPNISRPFAFAAGDITYLAMEYVQGKLLNELIAEHNGVPLPLKAVARIFEDLCRAVAYAHQNGVVHRDLKPQNVIVVGEGDHLSVKVLDFGVAKFVEQNVNDSTTQGRTVGSLFYLSPEQTQGTSATPASDVFALGSMLFELLTSRRMWAIDRSGSQLSAFNVPLMSDGVNSINQVVERINVGARPRPTQYRPELAPQLDGVIARAAAIEPDERHPTALALMADALEHIAASPSRGDLTVVQPTKLEDAEELETARPSSRLTSLLEAHAIHVPTRAIEGGVSSFLDPSSDGGEESTTRSHPAIDAGPEIIPTQLAHDSNTVPLRRALPREAPPADTALIPPSEISVQTRGPWYQSPRALIAVALVGSATLVGSTYVITRASIEEARTVVPLAREAPLAVPAPPPSAIATPAPEPTESPQTSPVEVVEASRPPRRRPSEPPKPSAPAAPSSELAGLLSRAKQRPTDVARLTALSRAIARAAGKVPDPEARTSIRRVAASSAMVQDLAGLEDAYRELEAALSRAGEALP